MKVIFLVLQLLSCEMFDDFLSCNAISHYHVDSGNNMRVFIGSVVVCQCIST